jgi:hypothetical protein
MKGASRGSCVLASNNLFLSRDAILLDFRAGDLGESKIAKEGIQVIFEPSPMSFDIDLVAFAFGDGLVFRSELLGGLTERPFVLQRSSFQFSAQAEVPVLRDVLRFGKAVGFG